MGRQIKFRIWNKETKNFQYNEPMVLLDVNGFMWESQSKDNKPINLICDTKFSEKYVIQQYTGLKDKNNKEIYEGDILEALNTGLYIVEYGEFPLMGVLRGISQFGFYGRGLEGEGSFPLSKNVEEYKVMGNTYENPKLLNK